MQNSKYPVSTYIQAAAGRKGMYKPKETVE